MITPTASGIHPFHYNPAHELNLALGNLSKLPLNHEEEKKNRAINLKTSMELFFVSNIVTFRRKEKSFILHAFLRSTFCQSTDDFLRVAQIYIRSNDLLDVIN